MPLKTVFNDTKQGDDPVARESYERWEIGTSPLRAALTGIIQSCEQFSPRRINQFLVQTRLTEQLLLLRPFTKNRSNLQRDQMKTNDFRLMSVDELWSLHEEISSILERRLAEEKAALERRLRQLKPGGVSNGFQPARRPYPRVLPKYRNPAEPAETWSGRGKQPRWLTAQLRSGKKLNDFLIQPSSSRARRSGSGRKQRRA